MKKKSAKPLSLIRLLMLSSGALFALGYLPGANALCIFGSYKSEISDYKNSYWESTEGHSAKADKQVLEQCTRDAEADKQRLSEAYLQLCKTGHITGENLLFTERLLSHPLYAESLLGKAGSTKGLADSVEGRMTWSTSRSDNTESGKENCRFYVGNNAEQRTATLLGLQVEGFGTVRFTQCMTENRMKKVVPTKSFRQCKILGW